MATQEKRGGGPVQVGGALLMVTFVILCLTVFAAISLVTAGSDHRLALRAQEMLLAYYEADSAAWETVARVDRLLLEQPLTEESLYPSALSRAGAQAGWELSQREEGLEVCFSQPAGEALALRVTLLVPPGWRQEEKRVRILGWRLENTEEWQAQEQNMNLWQPG